MALQRRIGIVTPRFSDGKLYLTQHFETESVTTNVDLPTRKQVIAPTTLGGVLAAHSLIGGIGIAAFGGAVGIPASAIVAVGGAVAYLCATDDESIESTLTPAPVSVLTETAQPTPMPAWTTADWDLL